MGVSWHPHQFLIVISAALKAAWINNIWRSQRKAAEPNSGTHVPLPPDNRTRPWILGRFWSGKFPLYSEMKANNHFKWTSVALPFVASLTTSLHGTQARSLCYVLYQDSALGWGPWCKSAIIAKMLPGFPISQSWGGRPWCVCFVMFLVAAAFACSIHQLLESSFQD